MQSAIASDGHLRYVSRRGELLEKRPDDDDEMSEASGLALLLWLFVLVTSFLSAVAIIALAGKARLSVFNYPIP